MQSAVVVVALLAVSAQLALGQRAPNAQRPPNPPNAENNNVDNANENVGYQFYFAQPFATQFPGSPANATRIAEFRDDFGWVLSFWLSTNQAAVSVVNIQQSPLTGTGVGGASARDPRTYAEFYLRRNNESAPTAQLSVSPSSAWSGSFWFARKWQISSYNCPASGTFCSYGGGPGAGPICLVQPSPWTVNVTVYTGSATRYVQFLCNTARKGTLAFPSPPPPSPPPPPPPSPPPPPPFVDFPHNCFPGNSFNNGGTGPTGTMTMGTSANVMVTSTTANSFTVTLAPNAACNPAYSGARQCCSSNVRKVEFIANNNCRGAIANITSTGSSAQPLSPSYALEMFPGVAPMGLAGQAFLVAKATGLAAGGTTSTITVTLKANSACPTPESFFYNNQFWFATYADTPSGQTDGCCGAGLQ